jgi:hypothetical protein
MGLFSFLFGGKKKAKAEGAPVVVNKAAPVATVSVTPAPVAAGVLQAKLRLKLAASLRAGQHEAAYEAAKGLADIQTRAGRRHVARGWQQQADRIKASMPV